MTCDICCSAHDSPRLHLLVECYLSSFPCRTDPSCIHLLSTNLTLCCTEEWGKPLECWQCSYQIIKQWLVTKFDEVFRYFRVDLPYCPRWFLGDMGHERNLVTTGEAVEEAKCLGFLLTKCHVHRMYCIEHPVVSNTDFYPEFIN